MNNIEVSVIIPIYNEEPHLRQCLDSILAQTLQEIEVLCVDDGSTDRSPEILQAYASKDNRIYIFRQRNQYAGAARNLGMKYARGRYLSFLDGDDYFEPDTDEQLPLMGKRKNRVAYLNNEWEWGWLRNAMKKEYSSATIALVHGRGGPVYYDASLSGGVRPEFWLVK